MRMTIPECSSSYLPSDMDIEAGDGQQNLVHSHSGSDNMSDVSPRCTKDEEAKTINRWGKSIFHGAKAANRSSAAFTRSCAIGLTYTVEPSQLRHSSYVDGYTHKVSPIYGFIMNEYGSA